MNQTLLKADGSAKKVWVAPQVEIISSVINDKSIPTHMEHTIVTHPIGTFFGNPAYKLGPGAFVGTGTATLHVFVS